MSYDARRLVAFMFGVLLGMPAISVAQERVMEVATRGPRFLLASVELPPKPPKVIQPETVPALRQRIAVDLDGVTLEQALTTISRQGHLPLVYSKSVLALDAPVQLRATDISVAAALTVVLLDTGIDVLMRSDGQVVLIRRGGRLERSAGVISGLVTDSVNQPVRGAEVLLKGTSFKTTTSDSGWYRLPFHGVSVGRYMVQARILGYRSGSREIQIADTNATIRVDMALQRVPVALDELVTTATGQQRRRDIGNSITTIRADSVMQTAPIRSLTDLLDGRVPGLTMQHTSGAPGDPARIRLRGISSVMRGNDPVVIVDGIRMDAAQSEARSGNLTNLIPFHTTGGGGASGNFGTGGVPGNTPAPSPLDQIDPNIIETIDVFKGPSAATLYGPDAANGVIVITTKRGKPGPTRWDATINYALTTKPGRWPEGYYNWGQVPLAGGVPALCTLVDLNCVPDSIPVRFQVLNDPDRTILGQGRRTALSLAASGGSQALTYAVTGSYSDETGYLQLPTFEIERFRTNNGLDAPDWMRRPHQFTKWDVTSKLTARLSPTAEVMLTATLGRSDQQRSTLEGMLSQLAGTYVDPATGLYFTPNTSYGLRSSSHFLEAYYQRTTASEINVMSGLSATWRPRAWFNGIVQAGLNVIPRDDELWFPTGLEVGNATLSQGKFVRGSGRSLVGTFSVQGQFRRPLGLGLLFETSVGTNVNTRRTDDMVAGATVLRRGTRTIVGAGSIATTESRTDVSTFGWYIEPRVGGKLFSLSAGLRLDGGSAHGAKLSSTGTGPGRGLLGGLLALPKFNLSVPISDHSWFPFKDLFSSLRLRGAFGAANVQPGPADRLRLYAGRVADDQEIFGRKEILEMTSVGNAELRPERSVEFEGGFDADMLDSRVSLEFTMYHKTQIDALMPVTLPLSVNGGGAVIQNIGNIRNAGLDLTLGVTPVQTPGLTWRVDLSYNRNTNTLAKLGRGVLPNKLLGIVEGYPIGSRWARPIAGYSDQNGNEVLEPSEIQVGDTMVFMGRLYPEYQTSLFTNIALFEGAVGITAGFSYDAGETQIDRTAQKNWVLARALIDPTASFADQAAVLASTVEPSDPMFTEYGLTQDVSTFRFTSFSVNYRAPSRVARLFRAQRLTVGVTGGNLWLHSTYRGKDPDVSAWSPGETVVDTGEIPRSRTWQFALSLQY